MVTKISFEITDKGMSDLNELSMKLGSTKSGTINAALTLLDWYIKQRDSGKIMAAVDERDGTYIEYELNIIEKKI